MLKSRGDPEGVARTGAASGDGPPDSRRLALTKLELFATVFVTGAVVMVVEILGTRLIGPVFGVSLFVWAALLAVTLASLAIGYYVGGVLVDRAPNPRLLGLVVTGGGALLGLVPALSHAVLGSAQSLGPRWGPLASATLLFAPCLVVLGTVGPIAVRLATEDLRATGHRVGGIYAVSTAGSLIGTLVTAFVLIPAFDTKHILVGAALVLVILGAIPLAWRGRPAALAAVLLPVVALAVPGGTLPPGIEVIDRSQSPYGLVEVIDDLNRGVRFLRADHSVIGAQFTRDRSPGFSFLHQLESVRFLRPDAKDMLQIGLGIGSLPSALMPYGIKADVVEIDPEVVRFAREYFDFSTLGDVYVEDARTFLGRIDRRYDLIVHDTFTGGSTPEHLLSLEVVQRLRDILRPGGVLALNFVGYQRGPKAGASWAVARTLRAVFPTVRVFRDSHPNDRPDDVANMIFFASDTALDFAVPENAHFENAVCEATLRSLNGWEVLQTVPDGPLITDELNPLARLQLPIAEDHFSAMNTLLPKEVWLH
jgi:SAM-dependent methyltransferase